MGCSEKVSKKTEHNGMRDMTWGNQGLTERGTTQTNLQTRWREDDVRQQDSK